MGRKSKYQDWMPEMVEKYARDGLWDQQIWENLGVGKDAFYDYVKKFPEFGEALKRGREPVIAHVENSLVKIATGYEYEERHTISEVNNEDGSVTIKEVKTIKKHVPPNMGAIAFFLTNKAKQHWQHVQNIKHGADDDLQRFMRPFKSRKAHDEGSGTDRND